MMEAARFQSDRIQMLAPFRPGLAKSIFQFYALVAELCDGSQRAGYIGRHLLAHTPGLRGNGNLFPFGRGQERAGKNQGGSADM
jgi:hypothetical protein